MDILKAIFLGIIQGLTEFLPVSSSGHLVLFQRLFNVSEDLLLFDIVLHLGTLTAVAIVFRKDIWALIRHPLSKQTRLLLVATLPTVAIFLLFESFFRDSFGGEYLGWGFLVTAVLLLTTDRLASKKSDLPLKPVGYPSAIVMGLSQGAAILPGISRSGSTVCSALIMGVDRKAAASFSFLMSIPIILGSTILEGYKAISGGVANVGVASMILGFVFAALSGFLSIRFMLKLIARCRFWGFSIYLFLLAVFTILNTYVFHLF